MDIKKTKMKLKMIKFHSRKFQRIIFLEERCGDPHKSRSKWETVAQLDEANFLS